MSKDKSTPAGAEEPDDKKEHGTELPSIPKGDHFTLVPRNLDEAMKFAKMMAGSDVVPKDFKDKPANVLVAVQMGLEVGLKPLQSLQCIAVINGRPTMWGDAILGLIHASGELEYCKDEWNENTQTATAYVKRKGKPERVNSFSMNDAKIAGLAGKDTYRKYPKRMCTHRARSWPLRDEFADVLKGLRVREEEQDVELKDADYTIREPKRLSDNAAKVEEFLKETTAGSPTAPKTENGGDTPAVPEKNPHVARLDKLHEEKGKTGKKVWIRYDVHTNDGFAFSTFDKKIMEIARELGKASEVEITWEMKGKYLNVTAIDPYMETAEPEPESDEPGKANLFDSGK